MPASHKIDCEAKRVFGPGGGLMGRLMGRPLVLKPLQIQQLRYRRLILGESLKSLSASYGLSQASISRLCNFLTAGDV